MPESDRISPVAITDSPHVARLPSKKGKGARWKGSAGSLEEIAAFAARLTPEGSFITVNRLALQLASLGREEVIGRPIWEISPFSHSPSTIALAKDAIAKAARGEQVSLRIPIRIGDGTLRLLQARLVPELDDQGKVRSILSTAVDVTSKFGLEDGLKQSEEHLKVALETAGLAGWVFSDKEELWWSPQIYQLLGIPSSDSPTYKAFVASLHPEDRAEVLREIKAALDGNGVYRREFRIRRSDGQERWIVSRAARYLALDGSVRLIGVAQDVTQARRERLRLTLLAKLGSIFPNRPAFPQLAAELAGVAVPDMADWGLIELMRGSGVIERHVVGAPPFGSTLRKLENQQPAVSRLAIGIKAIESGRPLLLCPAGDAALDGPTPWTEPSALLEELQATSALIIPLLNGGTVLGCWMVGYCTPGRSYYAEDLAVLEHAANLMTLALENARLFEEVQAMSRAKDRFLSVVSHELRNPLTPIVLWTKMLRQDVLSEDKREAALEAIGSSANALQATIDDLLDLSRCVSNRLNLELHRLDVSELIDKIIRGFRPVIEAKGLILDFTNDVRGSTLLADHVRLEQAVANLLSNAARFTPRGGRISVELSRLGPSLQIAISDTGQGIAPEVLPYIFEWFHQGDEASNPHSSAGLGVGLSVARYLIELHGGVLAASSPGPGRGATFTILLPEAAQHACAGKPQWAGDGVVRPLLSRGLQGVKALLVEDDSHSARAVIEVLESAGARVLHAWSVSSALEALPAWIPNILISNVAMARADGGALLRALRELAEEPKGIPAVAVSSFAHQEARAEALSAGFHLHLAKPLTPDSMLHAVTELIRNAAPKREPPRVRDS